MSQRPARVRMSFSLEAFAREQHCVATREQLLAAGVTRSYLAAQVAACRWRKLTPTVYVLHNGPLTEEQQWWAATLAVGPLAGRTSLQSFGIKGWPGKGVEVVVTRGAKSVLPEGVEVTVHESRRLDAADVHPARVPCRLKLERSAVDAAAWSTAPRAACGLLAAVVQQKRSTATKLRAELNAAGQVRHVRVLGIALDDIEGGAQAMSEVDLGRICRKYGLLPPERQLVRLDGAGRRRYVDARVSAPNGQSVLVEVDGALHLLVMSYWDDMHRGNELLISGAPTLRFPSISLHLDEDVVGNQLRRACGLDPLRLPLSA